MGLDGWKKVNPVGERGVDQVRRQNEMRREENRPKGGEDLPKDPAAPKTPPPQKPSKPLRSEEPRAFAGRSLESLKRGKPEGTRQNGFEQAPKAKNFSGEAVPATPSGRPDGTKNAESARPKGNEASVRNFESHPARSNAINPQQSRFVSSPPVSPSRVLSEVLTKQPPTPPKKGEGGEKKGAENSLNQAREAQTLAQQQGPKGPVAPPALAGEMAKASDSRLKEGEKNFKKEEGEGKKTGKSGGGLAGGGRVSGSRGEKLEASSGGVTSGGSEEAPEIYSRLVNGGSRQERLHDTVRRASEEYRHRIEKPGRFDEAALAAVIRRAEELNEEVKSALKAYGLSGGIEA